MVTQEQLAERAGISAKAISALERGERTHPYPHTVSALAGALQLSEAERLALQAAVPKRGSRQAQGGLRARLLEAGRTVAVVESPTEFGLALQQALVDLGPTPDAPVRLAEAQALLE